MERIFSPAAHAQIQPKSLSYLYESKRHLYISPEEIHKSLAEIYISFREIHKSLKEIHISFREICKLLADSCSFCLPYHTEGASFTLSPIMFRNGTSALPFSLLDSENQLRSLGEWTGEKPLVLFFFRGAFCATSRRNLLAWGDIHERIEWVGAGLIAISVDAPDELSRLKATLELPFTLLSDGDFAVSRAYGIYESDETDAGPQPHGEPATFVLDRAGNFAFSQLQSGPKGASSASEVLLMLLTMHKQGGFYW